VKELYAGVPVKISWWYDEVHYRQWVTDHQQLYFCLKLYRNLLTKSCNMSCIFFIICPAKCPVFFCVCAGITEMHYQSTKVWTMSGGIISDNTLYKMREHGTFNFFDYHNITENSQQTEHYYSKFGKLVRMVYS